MNPSDRNDFARLYDEEVWRVFGFFGYRVASRSEAEDLTQLTFERALRAWDRFDPDRGTPAGWLLAIARNLLIDHYRGTAGHETERLDGDRIDEVERITVGDGESELSAELACALDELKQREREIIALRFGADLRGPEIADVMSLSVANVQQILSRALRKLRAELQPALEIAS